MEKKTRPKSFDWYFSEAYKDEFLFYVNPVWPVNTTSEDKIGEDGVKEELESRISDEIKKGYIYVKDVTSRRVTVAFRSKRWLNDNFLESPRISYNFPRSLEWKWRISLPLTILKRTPWLTFRKFIEKKFKEFLEENLRQVFRDKFKILKKVNYNWFIYEADMDNNKFFVRLKYSVMLTLLAAGSIGKSLIYKRK